MRQVAAYAVSQLWRHPHPWVYGVYFGSGLLLSVIVTIGLNPWVGCALWMALATAGALAIVWRDVARWMAQRRGYQVLYVLPSPARWVSARLARLGYSGPVADRAWEMHVDEQRRWRWPDAAPEAAVRRFRAVYTADRLRWLDARPDDVALIITTFNHLPEAEMTALKAAGAWTASAPLDPRIPRVATARRQRQTQRRMFGGVVSSRDRCDPAGWTTVYVPPRIESSV